MSAYQTMLTRIWDDYQGLSIYEIAFKANYELLTQGSIKSEDIEYIVSRMLEGISSSKDVKRFHHGVHAPSAKNGDEREMYPLFYITPYDQGRKYVTLSTVTPQTHILSANSYELEILRLLSVFARDREQVKGMLERTKKRLLTTCFGNFCETGECFEASLVTLRFIATAFPEEDTWMKQLLKGMKEHMNDRRRHSGVQFYYWLTLSELPLTIAAPEIRYYVTNQEAGSKHVSIPLLLNKSFPLQSDHDRYTSPFGMYVMRNCLSKLDEYEYLKLRKPYISDRDGRLHFDTEASDMLSFI